VTETLFIVADDLHGLLAHLSFNLGGDGQRD
jgi:hypothetical protein